MLCPVKLNKIIDKRAVVQFKFRRNKKKNSLLRKTIYSLSPNKTSPIKRLQNHGAIILSRSRFDENVFCRGPLEVLPCQIPW